MKEGSEAFPETGLFTGVGNGGNFLPEKPAGRFGDVMNIRIQSKKAEAGEEGAVGIAPEKVGLGAEEEGLACLARPEGGRLEKGVKDA